MNTLLENIRASAILMKNLPSTLSGDALLISREEARRIGYELEACAERIEQRVPQRVEEWIDMHSAGASLFDREVLCVAACDLRACLSGMAIVPVEPTDKMIDAAERVDWSESDTKASIINMWQAMLSAHAAKKEDV